MTTKPDRLTMLRDALIECKKESVKDADEWQTYDDMMVKVNDLLTEERRKAGYMAVYPIVNGSAQEALFEGTKEQCKIYTDILLENQPEMKGNIIVLEL
jgi:hypothetical protein